MDPACWNAASAAHSGVVRAGAASPDRLAVEAGELSDVSDREALPVHGANLVHVPTSQQSGHLLQRMDLVTPILLGWGPLLRRCGEFSTGADIIAKWDPDGNRSDRRSCVGLTQGFVVLRT